MIVSHIHYRCIVLIAARLAHNHGYLGHSMGRTTLLRQSPTAAPVQVKDSCTVMSAVSVDVSAGGVHLRYDFHIDLIVNSLLESKLRHYPFFTELDL